MPGRCAVSDCEPTSWPAATRQHSSPSVPWLRLPWLASNLYLGLVSEQLTSGGSPDPRQPPFGAGISTDMALSGRLWGDVWTAPVPCALDDPPTIGSFVRPPAFASWILLLPLGICTSLTVRRLPLPADPIGVTIFRMKVCRSGRVPPVRRGLGFPQPGPTAGRKQSRFRYDPVTSSPYQPSFSVTPN